MGTTFAALMITGLISLVVIAAVLVVAWRFLPRGWVTAPVWVLQMFRLSGEEKILYVDGPLAGRIARLCGENGGLPPFQTTPQVNRAPQHGGNYTMPYERGLLCGTCCCWHYSVGWTHHDEANEPVDEWAAWDKQSHPRCPCR